MYTKIHFLFFVVFDFKFVNRVKGYEYNKFKRFSTDTEFFYQNSTNKIPNVIINNPAKMVRWKAVDINKPPKADNILDKTRRTETIPFNKKNTKVAHRFKPLPSDNYIKISPFNMKEYGKDLNIKPDYTIELKTETTITEPLITKRTTYQTSKTTHSTALAESSVQFWLPNDLSTQIFNSLKKAPDLNIKRFIPADDNQILRNRQTQLRQKMCKRFLPSQQPFDYKSMANLWQTMYYRIPESIKCFQILIRKVPPKQQDSYQLRYGNFSGAVDWKNVRLEISATTNIGRKHFLQGNNNNMGILENIIISRDVETGELVIHEETPDQWLVIGHLLLMRDCESGGIVVFSKVPYVPRRREIEDALANFHEYYGNGELSCDEDEVINKSFEAEEDVQSFWNK